MSRVSAGQAARLLALALALPHAAHAAPAPADPNPPPLDRALAAARARGRALVLDFSTEWCAPCKILATQVLPDPSVQAALERVVFVQYDAEKWPGRDAASRYKVTGFPTIVAVDQRGEVLDRLVGVKSPFELAAWVRDVADRGRADLPTLLAQAKARKRDGALALEIARRQAEIGDAALARRWFVTAEKLAKPGSSEAAEAAWGRTRLDVALGEQRVRAKLGAAYLAQFPSGPQAVEAAEAWSLAAPPRAEAERVLGRVVESFLAASPPGAKPDRGKNAAAPSRAPRLRTLILACLRAKAHAAALAAAAALDDDAPGLLLRAEVRHQRGENPEALELAEQARKKASPRERALVEAAVKRFKKGGADPGDTLLVADPLDRFQPPPTPFAPPPPPQPSSPSPGDARLEALRQRTTAFRQLVTRVTRECAPLAKLAPARIWIRVLLRDGKVDRVLVLDPPAKSALPVLLEGCLSMELRGQPFAHPIEGEDTFALQF